MLPFKLLLVAVVLCFFEGDAKFGESGARRRRCLNGTPPRRLKKRDRRVLSPEAPGGGEAMCRGLYPRLSCCSRSEAQGLPHAEAKVGTTWGCAGLWGRFFALRAVCFLLFCAEPRTGREPAAFPRGRWGRCRGGGRPLPPGGRGRGGSGTGRGSDAASGGAGSRLRSAPGGDTGAPRGERCAGSTAGSASQLLSARSARVSGGGAVPVQRGRAARRYRRCCGKGGGAGRRHWQRRGCAFARRCHPSWAFPGVKDRVQFAPHAHFGRGFG